MSAFPADDIFALLPNLCITARASVHIKELT
jgi:hypothetical protein